MNRIVLIHWNAAEARERIGWINEAGYKAKFVLPRGARGLEFLSQEPPLALLIDLSRLPSHGREIGSWVRRRKATRLLPIVFVGGETAKVERARALLPDATFAQWPSIGVALRKAITRPPAKPVVPDTMAAYAGTPLPKKLGIRTGAVVTLVGAPANFEKKLTSLPQSVRVRRRITRGSASDLVLLFSKSQSELRRSFYEATQMLAERGGLWVVWPKKTSGVASDLNENVVREFGLCWGWVDYKICSVDETWSGLLFGLRRSKLEQTK